MTESTITAKGVIRNGTDVRYASRDELGRGIVRFHECPEGYDTELRHDTHRYLVHFRTGQYAGTSRQVWLSSTDVIEKEDAR